MRFPSGSPIAGEKKGSVDMNQLANLDPGDATIGLILIVLLQTTVVILLGTVLSRTGCGGGPRRGTPSGWGCWFGPRSVLRLPLLPVVPAMPLWAIALPVTGGEANSNHGDQRPSDEAARSQRPRRAAEWSSGSIVAEKEPLLEAMAVQSVEAAHIKAEHATKPDVYRGGSSLLGGLTMVWVVGSLIGLARIGVELVD